MARHQARCVSLYNASRDEILCDHVELAETFLSRFVGLLGRRDMPAGTALWLLPSSGVHTIGMNFAIDVVAMAGDLTVLSLTHQLSSWRVAALHPGTRSVLELPAGALAASSLCVGDRLSVPA